MNERNAFSLPGIPMALLDIAAWILLVPIIHLISWLFGAALVVIAVIAVIWALRVLL